MILAVCYYEWCTTYDVRGGGFELMVREVWSGGQNWPTGTGFCRGGGGGGGRGVSDRI
eukprot:CAMPEP_0184663748 /NCGR_PEP_ID=MMETSP0308-20130426/49539_1 /TAXON_ID=38269 /ORGANISM="Gloeochaete witrockiana, Strain SAG 46.84" /LENGTH=57 /DNA_ID=CAMNT_0027106703 /DNA_START=514 /DNA_END=687 /DNA_ORIENTATION=-